MVDLDFSTHILFFFYSKKIFLVFSERLINGYVLMVFMKQMHMGILLIVLGMLVGGVVTGVKFQQDALVEGFVMEQGSCFLDDGTCLHKDMPVWPFVIGWAVSLVLILLGVYVGFIDKSRDELLRHQERLSGVLHGVQKKDKFEAFLVGFDPDTQNVLRAVFDEDGITQSTLRFKVGMSKTALSLVLKGLEDKGFVSRKDKGKTKQVFMVKRF